MSGPTLTTASVAARQTMRRLPGPHLARLAARGSATAFGVIYQRHHQEIYRYCHSLLGNEHDACDALQNTMLSAFRGLKDESREIAIRPWLFRIAHHESVSLLRSRRRDAPVDPARTMHADAASDVEAREAFRSLLADLELLNPRQRSALLMRELTGLQFREIGAALDTSPAGAKQAVYQARLALTELARGREMGCDEIRFRISSNDRRLLRGRRVRAHLRGCLACREFENEIKSRRPRLAAIAPPLAVPASLALIRDLLGGSGATGAAATGVAAGGAATGGMAGVVGSGALKLGVATLAVGAGVYAGGRLESGSSGTPATGESHAAIGRPAQPASAGSSAGAASTSADPRSRSRVASGGDGEPSAASKPARRAAPNQGLADRGGGSSRAAVPSGQADVAEPAQAQTPSGQTGATPGHSASGQPAAGGPPTTPPGHSGAAPGNSGAAPGHSGTPPGQGGTPPGQSGATPGQSGTAPGHTGAPPGQSGTAPGNSGAAPGHSGTPPGQGSTPPGQSGTAPGNSGAAPGNSGTPPGQTATPPGQTGTPPGHSGTAPGQSGTAPGQTGAPPGQGESGQGT